MVVVAVLVAGMSSTAHADGVTRRERMLKLLNQSRRNHGLPILRLNIELSQYAWRHSRAMADRNRLWHTTDLYRVVRSYGPATWGENIGAAGTVRVIRRLWMRSPGHRHNILKPAFRRVGIGVVRARGFAWVTAIFYGR